MSKSPITCHGVQYAFDVSVVAVAHEVHTVLDASTGKPAEGVEIQLQEYKHVQAENASFAVDPLAKG